MTGKRFFTKPLRKESGIYFPNIPHWGTSIPLLGILLASCTTTQIGYDGPCPTKPELQAISAELQLGSTDAIRGLVTGDTPPEVATQIEALAESEESAQRETISIATSNQLRLKQHIVDLEALSGCTK